MHLQLVSVTLSTSRRRQWYALDVQFTLWEGFIAGEREGGVKVELKPRAGRTEGLGGIRGFLAFPGRIRTRGGPFRVLSGT